MMLRILFTLAILAGLAAAPGAQQPFHWEADAHDADAIHVRIALRLERLVERIVERVVVRTASKVERVADRVSDRVDRLADRISDQFDDVERVRVEVDVRHRTAHARIETRRVGSRADGQSGDISDDPCDDRHWDDDDYRHCEVREVRLPAGPLNVDAGSNGGIRVEGWDGADILVRAIVQARARDEAAAKQLASGVEIQTGSGRVSATGPGTSGRREWWSVSYRISVPRATDLELHARNGGITIRQVTGTIRFDTTNGGVRLAELAGQVNGRTRNGGVNVSLSGSRWEGDGLDVETSNGGVTLSIPSGYNAELETRTVNGRFRSDYPLTLTGDLSPRHGISTTLGSGGPPVRVRTRNGGVKIEQR